MEPGELNVALGREGPRVEWKESGRDSAEILRAVCALANDLGLSAQPGYLVIGVNDRGEPVGTDTSDQALRSLTNRLTSTKILPNPSFDLHPETRQGKEVLVVRVHPQDVPPVVKVDGVAWVRSGTETRRANDADLARLNERRSLARLPFDLRPVPGGTLQDLVGDGSTPREATTLGALHLAAFDREDDDGTFPELERWLGQQELARNTPEGWLPTAAGVLLFGLDPQHQFPGAVVEVARYAGVDFDAPLAFRKTASGRLTDQLDAVWSVIAAHIVDVPAGTDGIRAPFAAEYPLEALKELARNLVQHRLYEGTNAPGRIAWFDDRVVFNNPGGPYGQASQGELGDHSDYRNPTITRWLVELGYVERLGRGIRRARALLEKNRNPPLEVETDGFTTITVRRRP